ncbi:hypothetical protein BO70DRAFT_151863 [Aspergillus heteromorphus CBS 117.55]|uniref:Uncharacterized protein n=1 Tax=Aspergillus heteromorphus CBS 117.55 TaxID=1448321 RepID=A0A317V3K3_9EURO|nr:uncharacterized protein BO70DRAFT_151863 [Aspergillus heteromorphus CBS 117.55]PWY68655.1 hypothetical protein BO70DRAFT_151863 [Aspergillus heteromorphus CBS 117.55]
MTTALSPPIELSFFFLYLYPFPLLFPDFLCHSVMVLCCLTRLKRRLRYLVQRLSKHVYYYFLESSEPNLHSSLFIVYT